MSFLICFQTKIYKKSAFKILLENKCRVANYAYYTVLIVMISFHVSIRMSDKQNNNYYF